MTSGESHTCFLEARARNGILVHDIVHERQVTLGPRVWDIIRSSGWPPQHRGPGCEYRPVLVSHAIAAQAEWYELPALPLQVSHIAAKVAYLFDQYVPGPVWQPKAVIRERRQGGHGGAGLAGPRRRRPNQSCSRLKWPPSRRRSDRFRTFLISPYQQSRAERRCGSRAREPRRCRSAVSARF